MAILQTLTQRLSSIWSGRISENKAKSSDTNTINGSKPASEPQYDPSLPPLVIVDLPSVLPPHRYNLADQGWTTVTFPDPTTTRINNDDILLPSLLQSLFQASQSFFDQSDEYKQSFSIHNQGNQGSEEGFNQIPGEKEFITLRRDSTTPKELLDPASKVWAAAGDLLNEMLGQIATSLDLERSTFTDFSKPCLRLDAIRRGTMLRLFRYENTAPKIVAEAHADLGLLSMVIGDTPGLEVWNKYHGRFVPIEQTYKKPTASVLVGRQLQRFSNGRYTAGGHRVVAYDNKTLEKCSAQRMDPRYRFSIVFVLRADWNVIVDTDSMTSAITGPHKEPIKGVTAEQFFRSIQAKHFNVNIGLEERARQKAAMAEAQKKAVVHAQNGLETESVLIASADCPRPSGPV